MQLEKFSKKEQVKLYLSGTACALLAGAAARSGLSKSLIVDMLIQEHVNQSGTIKLKLEIDY